MTRELRRLLIAPGRLAQAAAHCPDSAAAAPACEEALPILRLEDGESRYLSRVLRYGPGDRFAVVDGGGQLWSAELLDRSSARLEQPPFGTHFDRALALASAGAGGGATAPRFRHRAAYEL